VKPVVHGLEAEYWGKIDFIYLDRDDPNNQVYLDELGFRAQPFYVLLEPDGAVVDQWYGVVEADTFRAAFDAVLTGGG
jgi:thioredoxin-like negative regulator of GroEL